MTKRAARPPSPAPHRAASACSLMATTPTAPSRPHAPAAPVAEPGSGALRNLGCPQTWQAGKHAWASKSDRGARLDRSSARQARGAGLAAAAQSGQRWVGGRGHEPDGASPWRGRGLQHMRRGLAPGPPAPPGYARQRVQQRRHVVDQHLRHDGCRRKAGSQRAREAHPLAAPGESCHTSMPVCRPWPGPGCVVRLGGE